MKAKTIKSIIRAKMNNWIKSIDDPAVAAAVKKDVIVTGGCITSMLLKEPINDFDVYFRTRETTQLVAEYYVRKFLEAHPQVVDDKLKEFYVDTSKDDRISIFVRSAGVASEESENSTYYYFESMPDEETEEYVSTVFSDAGTIQDVYEEAQAQAREKSAHEEGKAPYRPVFLSTNAITLSGKIQLVLRFYGEPDQLHENYDFVHCTNYWESKTGQLVLKPKALEAILARELVYVGSKYPVCSIMRLRKFIKRGWSVNAGQIVKMIMQINELDLNNIEVLRDQLTGVDSAYFHQVLSLLDEKGETKIDSAYLIEIIDRIF